MQFAASLTTTLLVLVVLVSAVKSEPDRGLFNVTRAQVPLCTTPASLVELVTTLLGSGAASSQAKAIAAAAHAVIYGTPLLAAADTFVHGGFGAAVNSTSPGDAHNLPQLLSKINVFQHEQQLSTPGGNSPIVTPNVDTLYSTAWLDLSAGPLILTVPDTAGRYYVLQMLDMYTNLVSLIGSSTTGTKQGKFLIVPPGFKDSSVPAAFKACANGVNPGAPSANASSKISCVIRAPTAAVSLTGRIMVLNSDDDLPMVWKLQQGLVLKTLRNCTTRSSSFQGDDQSVAAAAGCANPGKLATTASKASKLLDTFRSATGALSVNTAMLYYRGIASMMAANKPPVRDASYFKEWYEPYVGLNMAGRFKPTNKSTSYIQGLQLALACVDASVQNTDVAAAGKLGMQLAKLIAAMPPGTISNYNGWSPSGATVNGQQLLNGDFGQDFVIRAVIAVAFIAALPQQEALYYVVNADNTGNVLSFGGSSSAQAYTVTFEGQPPARAFWSLTLYDFNTKLLVANSINRYAIGGLTEGLNWVPGSKRGTRTLTVKITPADQQPKEGPANWLPGPVTGRFYLVLRLYLPEDWVSNQIGGYKPPPVLPSTS